MVWEEAADKRADVLPAFLRQRLITALGVGFFRAEDLVSGVLSELLSRSIYDLVKTAKSFVVACTKESCPLAQFLEIV